MTCDLRSSNSFLILNTKETFCVISVNHNILLTRTMIKILGLFSFWSGKKLTHGSKIKISLYLSIQIWLPEMEFTEVIQRLLAAGCTLTQSWILLPILDILQYHGSGIQIFFPKLREWGQSTFLLLFIFQSMLFVLFFMKVQM